MPLLVDVVRSADPAVRDRALDAAVRGLDARALAREAEALDRFRRADAGLYERVRALFLLAALHRYHLPPLLRDAPLARVPEGAHADLCARRFGAAIDALLALQRALGPRDAWCSALAVAYREHGFDELGREVRASVRAYPPNRWTFEVASPADHPLRVRPELLARGAGGRAPTLVERTPVRVDLSHAAWSDLFFLAMDRPEAACVLNVSVDLAVHGRDAEPRPPVEAYVRVLDRPALVLASVDLAEEVEVASIAELFAFARDHLGLLKAAVIAAGVVPPSLEGSDARLADVLARVVGPGRGLEVKSRVRGIPKGSRLAVSTTLLACLIAACMRATGQTARLDGPLAEEERRLVAARAILGEWLGGSGGGWQDSGGLWPGFKRIRGARARPGDPEHGRSRGRLLPEHELLGEADVPQSARRALARSLVLVHGGMAQDVGPILRMVTERYLLRSEPEWSARGRALALLEEIRDALRAGDVRRLGRATTETFEGPIRTILPWATHAYVERALERVRVRFGERFLGFWMLGGMAGGGMGFLFEPEVRDAAREEVLAILRAVQGELEGGVPFAIAPIAYEFAVNERGSVAELWVEGGAIAPMAAGAQRAASAAGAPAKADPADRASGESPDAVALERLLAEHGFDRARHERVRADLRAGRIGLAANRLPARTRIEDAREADVIDAARATAAHAARGRDAIARGAVAVVTLAAGAGSRWTGGAGTVKALAPVARFGGRHRTFLEVHLAKTRRHGAALAHVVTTGYLVHARLEAFARARPGALVLSPGRAVGLRMVPTVRDLELAFAERARVAQEERAEKVRASLLEALCAWARAAGEASDYRDNAPAACLHPLGHAHEVLNLVKNGTLARLLAERPALATLLVHNVDALGADVDPALLGLFLETEAALGFELVPRRMEDEGGGLARVDGRLRLVEGLALPRREDELGLSFYSSMTTWIDVDRFLALLGLERGDLASDPARADAAARAFADRLPTYVTLKDVKKPLGGGREDVFPVSQHEQLLGDVTALDGVTAVYFRVRRERGAQLKEPAQLDGWWRDGSAAYVESLCAFA